MSHFPMTPLGLVIEPDADNPYEVDGILNPAAARGPDGDLYLFPRIVSHGNFSRIGIVKVLFDAQGEPCGVERLGLALEPETDYELRTGGQGGCEDPRITYVEPLDSYVMTYTAFSPVGPRIALAVSKDLLSWTRLGLATFEPYQSLAFDGVDNKDAASFPQTVPNPMGQLELAILHRPLFPGTLPQELIDADGHRLTDLRRESIWVSYTSMALAGDDPHQLCHFTSHHRLASPVSPWEKLKIGTGTPPIMTRHGWLIVYHGVSEIEGAESDNHRLRYAAGVMVLSAKNPQELLYRSSTPVLNPTPSTQRRGTPSDVVFPTGIDRRDDIGQADRYDVYYGMDDFRIGVARLDVPATLPRTGAADPPA